MSRWRVRRQLLLVAFCICAGGVLLGAVAGVSANSSVGESSVTGTEQNTLSAVDDVQFTVSSVTLEESTVGVGETIHVEAVVENDGSETAPIATELEIDGEVIETRTPEVQPAFPVIVRFETSIDEPGTYTVSVNGVEAESSIVVEDGEEGDTADEESTEDETADGTDDGDDTEAAQTDFEVSGVVLNPDEITLGESVQVLANISNNGDEPGDFEVELEIDGEIVKTATVPEVLPETEIGAQHPFEFEPESEGTYTVSVSGTEAEQELVVTAADEGGFFGFLGFLPLGLIRTVLLFIGLPLLVVYLALKALAIYLGY